MPYKDPEAKRQWQREHNARLRDEWLTVHGPCVQCGSWDNLQVDHTDPKTKISHNVWSWSSERRKAELAKCQVLCKPCHDEKSKGEHAIGEQHGSARLTEKQVREIHKLKTNFTQYELAEMFNVSQRTISHLLRGETWKHLSS